MMRTPHFKVHSLTSHNKLHTSLSNKYPTKKCSTTSKQPEESKFDWIPEDKNWWKVPLLDVTSFTHKMVAFSKDPTAAQTCMSHAKDDGASYIGKKATIERSIVSDLEFNIDQGKLYEGHLFKPRSMDEKWVIYYRQNKIICVRSWTKEVRLVADVEQISQDRIAIRTIQGAFHDQNEDPDFTNQTFEYLMLSHALQMSDHPVPILPSMSKDDPFKIAAACFSLFGPHACFAVPPGYHPKRRANYPLRSFSLLHLASLFGDLPALERSLKEGFPTHILCRSGFQPLHYAANPEISQRLLAEGASVDCKAESDGTTPLMLVVQDGAAEHAEFFLKHKANPNAVDDRGFSSLHRAAEMGKLDIVKMLCEYGADPTIACGEYTPVSLAKKQGHQDIVSYLESRAK